MNDAPESRTNQNFWVCKGGIGGKSEHEEIENYTETCLICNSQRPVDNNPLPGIKPINRGGLVRIVFGILSLGMMAFLGYKYYGFTSSPRVKADEVTVGIITSPDKYEAFKEYLGEKLIPDDFFNYLFNTGRQVKINVNGNSSMSYLEAKEKIRRQEWDVTFTLSPALSVTARDSGYTFIARMFPDQPPFYRSALFVKANSSIKSIRDLTPNTVLALGDFNSTSSFYVPVYDLYGKTLTINVGLRGISRRVKGGEVDVGAGVARFVEDDSALRIIHVSRDIPGSGVYVSPRFSQSEQQALQQVMLNAPEEIRKDANYGEGKEPDYTEFTKVRARVEEILSCANFSRNPVRLFCPNKFEIKGRVNGGSVVDATANRLMVSGADGKIYRVLISRFILPNPNQVQGKLIRITGVKPKQLDESTYELVITSPNQFTFSDDQLQRNENSSSDTQIKSSDDSTLKSGSVTAIEDGDTITGTFNGESTVIRLACIDAPETSQLGGQSSTLHLQSLLPLGQDVTIRSVTKDRFGRTVAEIYKNGESINLQMVSAGHAVVYRQYLDSCSDSRQEFLDAEAKAKSHQLAIWKQPNPEMPWDFRRRQKSP